MSKIMRLIKEAEKAKTNLENAYAGVIYERKGNGPDRQIVEFFFREGEEVSVYWRDGFGTGVCSLKRFRMLFYMDD